MTRSLTTFIAVLSLWVGSVSSFSSLATTKCRATTMTPSTTRLFNLEEPENSPFTMRDKYKDSFSERNRVNYRTTFTHDDWVEFRKPGRNVLGDDVFGEPFSVMMITGLGGIMLIVLLILTLAAK
ncbi:expressed unknown protein [Seminavis robusta]|uniref:Uncharacterized protein n=1 Tax=Seminavis robusta TaxID=568900 RepID=A0A9N8DB66_9STRA|nr:expressed unknown protein [Seminavis robusta]|eukprot:Sro62_g035320.1 n/a (125) ;mRNA; f:46953-47327